MRKEGKERRGHNKKQDTPDIRVYTREKRGEERKERK